MILYIEFFVKYIINKFIYMFDLMLFFNFECFKNKI